MNKNKLPLFMGIICAAACVILACFLPEFILKKLADKDTESCQTAPYSYYLASDTAMAKQASGQLTALERIRLVSGSLNSTYEMVSTDDGSLNEAKVISMAKEKMEYFYDKGIYPYSLSSSYGNWYSWNTELYKYTDSTFNTYTVYLWVIKFTRYDNRLVHTVIMTENGTVLAAEVNDSNKSVSSIQRAYSGDNTGEIFGDSDIYIGDVTKINDEIALDAYPYFNTDNVIDKAIYKIELSDRQTDLKDYYIYQYKTDSSYGIGIMPAE